MKILSKQNLILNRQIKCSMINFQDFHLQGSFQACPVLSLYFNCPVFTPNDYTWFVAGSRKMLFCGTVWNKLSENVSIFWFEL